MREEETLEEEEEEEEALNAHRVGDGKGVLPPDAAELGGLTAPALEIHRDGRVVAVEHRVNAPEEDEAKLLPGKALLRQPAPGGIAVGLLELGDPLQMQAIHDAHLLEGLARRRVPDGLAWVHAALG